jgi:hypothetical protein
MNSPRAVHAEKNGSTAVTSFRMPAVVLFVALLFCCRVDAISDQQARELAKSEVRRLMSYSPAIFLDAVRIEELEREVFALQKRVTGDIREKIFVYEVSNNGYEIIPPKAAILHTSSDAVGQWYVGVSRDNGTAYPLFGFLDPTQGFNRLASDVGLMTSDMPSSRLLLSLYQRLVFGPFYDRCINDELQLRQMAERWFWDRNADKSRGARRFSEWWHRKLRTLRERIPLRVSQEGDTFEARFLFLVLSDRQEPSLVEHQISISSTGTVSTERKTTVN